MDPRKQPQDTRKRDEESRQDVAERDQPSAPPASGTGQGGKPEINTTGTPEVVPGPPHDGPDPNHQQKADRTDTSDE
ncbi:hypothetical protein [Limnoglobus roseus]|uniref:Uncharacterized protein n=1 Tax=Limnoglobus roseus TaxID=2598579 RepID=A0A5C1AQW2_9BACT|nr:hypothetical protein [Limnoglobus roseus]QEL19258.1 hypothetical protein PX52LOC_06320 [Limnoglobus roseus]